MAEALRNTALYALVLFLLWLTIQCLFPEPQPERALSTPTPTVRIPVVIIPTATLPLLEIGPVLPKKTPKPPIVLDLGR